MSLIMLMIYGSMYDFVSLVFFVHLLDSREIIVILYLLKMQVKYNASNQTIHSTLSQAMLLFRTKRYLSAQTNFYCEYELFFSFQCYNLASWLLMCAFMNLKKVDFGPTK